MNHIQLEEGRNAICNVVQSLHGGILIATSAGNRLNQDIPVEAVGYESRPRNLRAWPFSFPEPIHHTDYLAAWWAADLAEKACAAPETMIEPEL